MAGPAVHRTDKDEDGDITALCGSDHWQFGRRSSR